MFPGDTEYESNITGENLKHYSTPTLNTKWKYQRGNKNLENLWYWQKWNILFSVEYIMFPKNGYMQTMTIGSRSNWLKGIHTLSGSWTLSYPSYAALYCIFFLRLYLVCLCIFKWFLLCTCVVQCSSFHSLLVLLCNIVKFHRIGSFQILLMLWYLRLPSYITKAEFGLESQAKCFSFQSCTSFVLCQLSKHKTSVSIWLCVCDGSIWTFNNQRELKAHHWRHIPPQYSQHLCD